MDTIAETNDVLRQRIDALELAAKERRGPWFKQPSIVVSLVALFVSVITTVYTQSSSKQESIRSKKEELRKLVLDLLQLQNASLNRGQNPDLTINAKHGVYLKAAERLVADIPNEVSSYEYIELGNEELAAGNVSDAQQFHSKAVDAAKTAAERSQALRFLGMQYFSMNDIQKARDAFSRANREVGSGADDLSLQSRGLNFEAWARGESQRGFAREASEKLAAARAEYERLTIAPMRQQFLRNLEDRVKSTSPWTGMPNAPTKLLALPVELREALAQLRPLDIRWIVENDISGDIYVTEGTDPEERRIDRDKFTHLVSLGLLTWLTNSDLKAAASKTKARYDYGLTRTPLFSTTREYLLEAASDAATIH